MEVKQAILDTRAWAEMDWQAVLRVLSERRRKRKLQSLPDEVSQVAASQSACPGSITLLLLMSYIVILRV